MEATVTAVAAVSGRTPVPQATAGGPRAAEAAAQAMLCLAARPCGQRLRGRRTPTCAAGPTAGTMVFAHWPLPAAAAAAQKALRTGRTSPRSPPGPGGPGWGGMTNGSCTVGTYEPGGAWTNGSYTWYWPGDIHGGLR